MPHDSTPLIVTIQVQVCLETAKHFAECGQAMSVHVTPSQIRRAMGVRDATPTPLSDVEQAIVDVLSSVGAPMTSDELSTCDEVGVTPEHVRRLLSPSSRLRKDGVIGIRKPNGYYLL